MNEYINVLIGVPSTDSWTAAFGTSLMGLITKVSKENQHSFGFANARGSVICANRTDIADSALANACTHLLFIDCDMIFPSDLLARLLDHNLPIVAVNYVTKEIPAQPVTTGFNGERITSIGKTGLEYVKGIGFGACLINIDVLRNLPQPWFDNNWDDEFQVYNIEDWCFCQNALAHGYNIMIDHDLSQEISHRGGYDYSWKDCA